MADLVTNKITGDPLGPSEWNQLAEIDNAITTSGQTPSTGNTNQIGIAMSKYASSDYFTDSGAADAYVLTATGSFKSPDAYFEGMKIRFRADNANTGATTINVATLGVKSVKKADGSTALAAGDIPTDRDTEATYDGTNFRLSGASTNASTSTAGITRYATSAEVNTGTSTTTAITPAALSGAQTMRARRGTTDQGTITSGVATKVQFNVEDWDVGSYYDNATNFRFLPTVAGYFRVTVSVAINSSGNFDSRVVSIFKNGTEWSSRNDATITSNAGQTVSMSHTDEVYLNGSTDYIEGFASTSSAGTILFKNNNSTFLTITKTR